MNKLKRIFYDSPESGRWINSFLVLLIKRDHHRILNAVPRIKEVHFIVEDCECYRLPEPEIRMVHDFKILAN
jgi:hypothetical protein